MKVLRIIRKNISLWLRNFKYINHVVFNLHIRTDSKFYLLLILLNPFSLIIFSIFLRLFGLTINIAIHYRNGFILSFPLGEVIHHPDWYLSPYSIDYLDQIPSQGPINFNHDDLIVDIGSHYGTFSIPLATAYSTHLLCIEADPTNFKILENNVHYNSLSHKISLFNAAFCETSNCSVNFTIGDASTRGYIGNNKYLNFKRLQTETIAVDAITPSDLEVLLGGYFARNIYPKLLKMDIEGAEHSLANIKSSFFTAFDYVIIEYHTNETLDISPLDNILIELADTHYMRTNLCGDFAVEYFFARK